MLYNLKKNLFKLTGTSLVILGSIYSKSSVACTLSFGSSDISIQTLCARQSIQTENLSGNKGKNSLGFRETSINGKYFMKTRFLIDNQLLINRYKL